jgi:hypothetical protein
MPTESKTSEATSRRILVAGDVCLDVVGVPVPPQAQSANAPPENWRLTGEMRTHFLPGGAMLLAEFIRAPKLAEPLAKAEKKAREEIKDRKLEGKAADEYLHQALDVVRCQEGPSIEDEIMGPRPSKPGAVDEGNPGPLYTHAFLAIAERLRRDEIVHSLLAVNLAKTADPKEKRKTLRIENEHGYSGPANGDPTLVINYSAEADAAQIIVLDDTGNRFRKNSPANPWPRAIRQPATASDGKPLIIYKLHRPFPNAASDNALWQEVATQHCHNRLVIVSIDDLRSAGAPISLGLSWERTALDVVWHLLNAEAFSELRNCPQLVIRLGLDGAILWQDHEDLKKCRASLIYDPESIEGGFALKFDGRMVSYGSAFTAGLVHELAVCSDPVMSVLVGGHADSKIEEEAVTALHSAIQAGLLASRRVLEFGFGSDRAHPRYPGAELVAARGEGDARFACQPIPIIPGALEPDRGRWRLLNDIFDNKSALLNRAVALTATGRKPPKEIDDSSADAKEDRAAAALLKEVPAANFGALRTYDRREIEHYRALHTLLRDYLREQAPPRPLSFAVFGPPGAGKSFGVKEVAASLKGQPGCKEVETLTFNLSLYQKPDELAAAFHLVRDVALKGKVPLVFFDEFDTALDGVPLGWLRCFLSPMQDGEFLDRGAPHPVGQAIFVFAGGTCATFEEFIKHRGMKDKYFKAAKGPDFLSRLRATLGIPSLNFATALGPVSGTDEALASPDTFDPYGDIDGFPCEAAIVLRRAGILAFNLKKKAPTLVGADGALAIDPAVLRPLLHLPGFGHGNRSFEALLDMSHLLGATCFTPSLLPAPFQIPLHADAGQLGQLVGTAYPYTREDRFRIAKEIHKHYIKQRKAKKEYKRDKPSHQPWEKLIDKYRHSNAEQADDIPRKLFALGLWLRKTAPAAAAVAPGKAAPLPLTKDQLEEASRCEHDRWVAAQRSNGYIYGQKDNAILHTHPCILPWDDPKLPESEKDKDRDAIRAIPRYLAAAGYEVIKQTGNDMCTERNVTSQNQS